MKYSRIFCALALSSIVAVTATVALAGTTVKAVRAKLAPAVEDGAQKGYVRLIDVEKNGVGYQRVLVYVSGLDVVDSPYQVVLDNGMQQADLGSLQLVGKRQTRGYLRFDTRTGTLPEGVLDLEPFSGGTVHVRFGAVDVATATLPAFVAPEGPETDTDAPTDAIAFGYGGVTLGDTSSHGSGPVAKLAAFAGDGPGGVVQTIGVVGLGFPRGGTFTVVLTGGSEDTLGSFTARSFLGWGGLAISTRRGGTIPGGSVSGLAGRGIEIRDASGAVVLSGAFPALD